MSKVSDHFKETIQDHLQKRAEEDPLFAKNLEKEDKDIDGCVNYILKEVKRIGAQGYTDDEIFNLAAHYYDEDDLKEADPIKMGVVINHKPELTEEEKKELKEQARNEVLNDERRRLHSVGKRKAGKKEQEGEQSNLFSS